MFQVFLQNGTAPSCSHRASCMCEDCSENGSCLITCSVQCFHAHHCGADCVQISFFFGMSDAIVTVTCNVKKLKDARPMQTIQRGRRHGGAPLPHPGGA